MIDKPEDPSQRPSDTPPRPESAAAFGRAQPGRVKPKPAPRPPKSKAGLASLIAAFAVGAILMVGAIALVQASQFLATVPQIPDKSALRVVNQAPGMTFEDASGAVIASRGPRHGHEVQLSELPPYVPQAFLAAEDKRFYHHGAVDMRGIARAVWINFRAGRTVQGGSTLTQQLAKTLFLVPDQTLRRKLQEAVIAFRMEQMMSKDEVLELYLNRIFFGDNAYGIDAAAQTYFGKPASRLDLQEAALLAALPKAPTRLALTNDMSAALQRSHLILAVMAKEGWITPAQVQVANASPPVLAPEAPGEGDYGYIIDMASAQAVQIAGGQAPDLIVRLSIDPALQGAAQSMVREVIAADGKRSNASQAALVLLAPDGAIRALVGGTDHRLSAFNRATQAERQPGSAFKPFIYAAALENGVRPTDIRQDAPVRIGLWSPANFGGGYRGAVTVAQALAHSINTVAVRLANEVGVDKLGEIAHRFGVASIPDRPNLSIALGAYEVNLLELTSGYQVFQQGGQRVQPYLIQQITSARGDTLFDHTPSAGVGVYDAANAANMVRMMEGVVSEGTGTRAAFGRPAAGKTGTSQNFRDAWFVGFTPDWVCGVWVGNDGNQPMNKVTGGEIPAEIWRRMMITAHQNIPPHDFAWIAAALPAATTTEETTTTEPDPDANTGDEPPIARTPLTPAPESAPDPDARETQARAHFYDSLSDDFDQADGAAPDGRRPSRREEPPPPDDAMGPPPDRYR